MKRLRAFLILVPAIVMLLPGQLVSQIPPSSSWEYLGPEGGNLTALAQNSATGNLYTVAYGSPARIFRSTNNGDLWENISQIGESIGFIAPDPQWPQNIVAVGSYLGYGTNMKVYKSSDAGTTWQIVQFTGLSDTYYYPQHLRIDQADPKRLTLAGYCYSYQGNTALFCAFECNTTDGGDSWTVADYRNITSGQFYVSCSATDPADAKTKYFGGYVYSEGYSAGKLFKTVDNGTSWVDITGTSLRGFVQDLYVDRNTPAKIVAVTSGGVYISIDRGTTWQRSGGFAYGTKICKDPGNSAGLYIHGSGTAIYRSTDGGMNWESLMGQLAGGSCIALAIDPSATGTLYAATQSGFYRSVNSGQTWTQSNKGLACARVPALKCAPSDPKSMYISFMYSGFYKTSNTLAHPTSAGIDWQKMPEYPYCEGIMRMEVSPSNPDIIYIQEGSG